LTIDLSAYLISFSLLDVGEFGFFLGGILTCTLFVLTAYLSRRIGLSSRIFGVPPKLAQQHVIAMFKSDEIITSRLGPNWNIGSIQLHGYIGGFESKRLKIPLMSNFQGIKYWMWTGPSKETNLFSLFLSFLYKRERRERVASVFEKTCKS